MWYWRMIFRNDRQPPRERDPVRPPLDPALREPMSAVPASPATPASAPKPDRRMVWVALLLGVASLAGFMGVAQSGGTIHWWQPTVAGLVVANLCVGSLGVIRRWPRIEKEYHYVSVAVALTAITAIVMSIMERLNNG